MYNAFFSTVFDYCTSKEELIDGMKSIGCNTEGKETDEFIENVWKDIQNAKN